MFLVPSYVVNRSRPYYFPLYNVRDFRLTLILVVLLLLGVASYAERNTAGPSDTTIFVCLVLVVVVLAGVAIHAVVVDVLQILRERKSMYSANRERKVQLMRLLGRERDDFDEETAEKIASWTSELAQGGSVAKVGVFVQPPNVMKESSGGVELMTMGAGPESTPTVVVDPHDSSSTSSAPGVSVSSPLNVEVGRGETSSV